MKRIGEKVQWNTKYGVETGVVTAVRIRFDYNVKIDKSSHDMVLTEYGDETDIRPGDPNREFALLVSEMRQMQAEYFRTNNQDVLIKSKQIEKKVDSVLSIYLPNIFNQAL